MSRRVRINGRRIVALRTSSWMVGRLQVRGRRVMGAANADFQRTASKENKRSQKHAADSPTPYDMSTRVGTDRARVYVQTASYAARRHENSTDGSSLIRGLREG